MPATRIGTLFLCTDEIISTVPSLQIQHCLTTHPYCASAMQTFFFHQSILISYSAPTRIYLSHNLQAISRCSLINICFSSFNSSEFILVYLATTLSSCSSSDSAS